MPKEEWGVKRLCPTTGKRFYDLNKDPIVSPYTGEVVTLNTGNKSRVSVSAAKIEKPTKEIVTDDDDLLADDDDTDVDLGDDVLDDDDDSDDVSLDEIADVASDDDDS